MTNTKKYVAGVYILANDHVFDLAVAFLNSFRAHNPDMALCLIPFNDCYDRIAELKDEYNFAVFDDRDLLQSYDEISYRLHGRIVGQYRKLAVWKGAYERFIFIDIDTAVLRPLNPVFGFLENYDFVAGHSDYPNIRSWTWLDTAYAGTGLTAAQIDYAANTGFFASKSLLFSPAKLQQIVTSAMGIRKHMQATYEQPFLNYLVVTLGINYTSLSRLSAAEPNCDIPGECWAGDPNCELGPNYELLYNGALKSALFVHWAGCWHATKVDRWYERFCLICGFPVRKAVVRRRMRLGKLWRHYRYAPSRKQQT